MNIGLFVGALPTGKTINDQVADIVDAERRGFDSYTFAQTGRPMSSRRSRSAGARRSESS